MESAMSCHVAELRWTNKQAERPSDGCVGVYLSATCRAVAIQSHCVIVHPASVVVFNVSCREVFQGFPNFIPKDASARVDAKLPAH
jgi:hypothetical protein